MKQYVPYIVIGILVAALVWSFFRKGGKGEEAGTTTVFVTDTVTIVEKDTILAEITKFVSETIVDTVRIETVRDSAVYVPITRRYYKGTGYEAWVSGYRPNLDSLVLYPETKYQYITNQTTTTVVRRPYSLYVYGGAGYFSNNGGVVKASIGLGLTTPKRLGIGVGASYLEGAGFGFEINIAYRIFER